MQPLDTPALAIPPGATQQELYDFALQAAAIVNTAAGRTLLTVPARFAAVLSDEDFAKVEKLATGKFATAREIWDTARYGDASWRVLAHVELIELGKQLSARYASKKRGPTRHYLIAKTVPTIAQAAA